jgi:hypothetical protein
MEMPTSIYEELKGSEIRLLQARMGNGGSIQFELTTHTLNSKLEYYALSYVWGDPKVTKNITVNGQIFAATANLVAALEILAPFNDGQGDLFMWIDAICINQNNLRERAAQVRMMSAIFMSASSVIAWLGPEGDQSTEVIELIKHIANEITSSPPNDYSFMTRPPSRSILDNLSLTISGEDASLLALVTAREPHFRLLFHDRQFWNRAWIFQELVLAQKVSFLCGKEIFKLTDMAGAAVAIDAVSYEEGFLLPHSIKKWWPAVKLEVPSRLKALSYIRIAAARWTALQSAEDSYSIVWEILVRTSDLAATDPRDKIYSLLSLIKINLDVDYSKSVVALYLEVAGILFGRVPMNEWFDMQGKSYRDRMTGLPTWVIDWDSFSKREKETADSTAAPAMSSKLYNAAAGIYSPLYSIEIKGPILTIPGVLFDTVQLLAPVYTDSEVDATAVFHLATEVFRFDITGGNSTGEILYSLVPPGTPRGQASLRLASDDIETTTGQRIAVDLNYLETGRNFARCLRLGEDATEGVFIMYEDETEKFEKLFLGENITMKSFERAAIEQGNQSPVKKNSRDVGLIQAGEWGMHFGTTRHFYTMKGYLGHSQKCAQEGDLVCVLQECRLPVLLRKVDNYYQFVSTCFVLGLMDGEAGDMLNSGELVMRRFNIH